MSKPEERYRRKLKSCSRIIPFCKYARGLNPNDINWWNSIFDKLEKNFSIPAHRRKSIINEVFTKREITRIFSILSLDSEMDEKNVEDMIRQSASDVDSFDNGKSQSAQHLLKFEKAMTKMAKSDAEILSTLLPKKLTQHLESREPSLMIIDGTIDEEKSQQQEFSKVDDVMLEKARRSVKFLEGLSTEESLDKIQLVEEEKKLRLNNVGDPNPYTKFYKRREDRAAIWRDLPSLKMEEMNLTQKSDAITSTIAADFINWLKSLGGDSRKMLSESTIKNMFEIGFHMHASTSLSVHIKEMPSVTKEVAMHRNLPKTSYRANLRQQLKRDVKAAGHGASNVAFGKMLPKELRKFTLKEDLVSKWIQSHRMPHDLISMSAVWKGIEGLRSTRAFCAYLYDHPEISPPPYLKALGMVNETINRRSSTESVEIAPTT